jgi:hypothetical protein
MLAAAANEYKAAATVFPGKLRPIPTDNAPQLLARIDLVPGEREQSELYDAIPRRHTNRSAFLPHSPLAPQFLDTLGGLAGNDSGVRIFLFTAESDRKRIVEISSAANTEIYSDPEVDRGSRRWFRTRWSAVQKYRDGLPIDSAGLPPIATGIAKMMPL